MNWLAIARKEFRDIRRSKTLWGLTAVVTILLALPILTQPENTPRTDLTPVRAALSSLVTLGMFLLPLALLVPSYDSITGELESGSAIYLLGLPNSRLEAIAGKLVGRTAASALGIVVAFGIGAILLFVRFGSVPVFTYLALSALTLYFAAVWTAIGVGISAFAGTRSRALASAMGSFFLFVFLWIFIADVDPRTIAAYVVESVLGLSAMPQVYDLVFRLSPATAYAFAGNELIKGTAGQTPFFLQGWFMLVILAVWLVGPLTVGYLRFRNSELI